MNDAFKGLQSLDTFGSDYNALQLFVKSILAGVHTATLVRIIACTNAGGVTPVGSVDVQPLVNLVDGDGNMTVHGAVYKLPYFRLQGGGNAVILDPQVGDIGLAIFCDRDISTVIATKEQANPGSGRWFDMADGVYIGGMLNGTPAQYVQFSTDGIAVVSPVKVTVTAPEMDVTVTTFNLQASGSVTINSPAITIEGGGTSVDGRVFLDHEHDKVTPGAPGQHSGGVV